VNVLFSDQGSEIFNAFPLSFPAERGGEQINKELLWNSERSRLARLSASCSLSLEGHWSTSIQWRWIIQFHPFLSLLLLY
jgi:hypothetical protein